MPKFLIPMDYSKEAYLALDWTVKLAAPMLATEIYLITVGPASSDSKKNTFMGERVQSLVTMLRENIPEKVNLFGVYRTGKVPEAVRDFCQKESIDLVVMTTRGRLGADRTLEGSFTEDTVRLVPCPILVLHLNQTTVAKVRERFEGFLPARVEPPPL